jgi:general secretion pathway protein M
VLAAVYLIVIAPALSLYSRGENSLDEKRMLEPHLRAAAAEVPLLRAQLAEFRRAAATQKLTFDGATDAIASAGLQSRIEGLAGSAGVTIASTEALPAEAQGTYRRIGLRFSVSGTYDSLVKLIAAVQTANPPLVVQNLQIHGTLRPQDLLQQPLTAQRQLPAQTALPLALKLDARLEVCAFRSQDMPVVAEH